MVLTAPPEHVEAVRRFSRFYTRKIGVLHEGLLDSPFSLTEGRVLYELAHHETTTASELAKELELDPGYLSRMLKSLERRGFLVRKPARRDARQTILSLSEQGHQAFAEINARSQNYVGGLLGPLAPDDQSRLVGSMATITDLLDQNAPRKAPYILRPHQPGDIGWVIHRHGALYAQEYGFDETFEALVAEVSAQFLQNFDPGRERCWIAERDGHNVGSVFLVRKTDDVAKLRLLLVEPSARGLGIGARLVEECIRFARLKGYKTITLWTNDCLHAAIHIYRQAGFQLIQEEQHRSFGQDLVGQDWEIALD
ncbi:MAG: bifunctional helix-turn-helix transcriptional regulator/GNAT family N-acetyltransferase [Pseudomonadota bacterium]